MNDVVEENYEQDFERVRAAVRNARKRLNITDLQIDVFFHVKMGKGSNIPKSIMKKICDKRRPYRLPYNWAEALAEILKIEPAEIFIPDRKQGELPIDIKTQDEKDAIELAAALSSEQKEVTPVETPEEKPVSQQPATETSAANENLPSPALAASQKSPPDLVFKKDGEKIFMKLNVHLSRDKFNKLKLALPVSRMECRDEGEFIHCVTGTKLEILPYQAGIISNIIYLED